MLLKLVAFKKFNLSILLLAGLGLVGCGRNPVDPWEPINRGIFALNRGADRLVIRPVTKVYCWVVPKPIKIMVGNFFQNLDEIPTIVNDILLGEFSQARYDTARFVMNTTLGLGGLFDVASRVNPEKHSSDFGLTLAKYGWNKSHYVVLPLFGPSTTRDGIGRLAYYFASPWAYMKPKVKLGLFALYVVHTRMGIMELEPVIQAAAVDEYVFIRDIYLQNREYLINGEQGSTAVADTNTLEGPPE